MPTTITDWLLHGRYRDSEKVTAWHITAASLLLGLGLFAIIEPVVAAIEITRLVAWLLIIGGIIRAVGAFQVGGEKRLAHQFVIGIAGVIGGICSLTYPRIAILLLALLMLAAGTLEIIT